MGRKAKNKQPPPAPYSEVAKRITSAKGKRKADDVASVKPAKRAATANGTVKTAANRNGKRVADLEAERGTLFDQEGEDADADADADGFPGLQSDEDEGSDEDDGDTDEEYSEGQDVERADTDDELAALGLPKKGTKLSERQKRKALAEAERLEELLKSQGYSLEDDDDEEGEEGGDQSAAEQGESDSDEERMVGAEEDDDPLATDGDVDLNGEGEDSEEGVPDDEDDDEMLEEDEGEGESDEGDDIELPTLDDGEGDAAQTADLQSIQMRIQEIVNVLNNFKQLGKGGRSRSEYTEQLLRDICNYYGYNRFLAEKFFELFSPTEAIAFFEANETPRPVTIRANTLRTRRRDLAQALINRGVNLEPLPGKWTKVGLQVFESSVPIGATPEYLAGHYMLQAASSFLPCIALAPQPHERVLDMASAPGGKSTYLAALMQNTGVVFANDSNKARTKSLTANVHRLGCNNVVVCNYDARMFPKVIGGFDRVLLDSPCSGSGVVSKDASVKTNKSDRDLQLLTHLQKQLILCAIDSINPRSSTGGYVVYSTCSVLVEENEQVVQYALEKRKNVRIVPSGIDFGREGFKRFRGRTFDDKMHLTKRVFPHVHNMDGFFFCKLKVEPAKTTIKSGAATRSTDSAANASSSQTDGQSDLANVTFDDEEDAELIAKSLGRQRGKNKTKVRS